MNINIISKIFSMLRAPGALSKVVHPPTFQLVSISPCGMPGMRLITDLAFAILALILEGCPSIILIEIAS